jgi:molecular chaperone GrpE
MKKKIEEHKKDKPLKGGVPDQEEQTKEEVPLNNSVSNQDLAASLKDKEKEAAGNYEKYLRAVADFDNYKKYVAKDRADLIKYSNERIIKDILPILDSLDRAIHHAADFKDIGTFIDGVKIIQEQMTVCLEKYGVKPIEAIGQPFNPEIHEALMLAESDEHKEGTVLQEFEKGYLLNDRLLRAAKVSVSKRKSAEEGTEQDKSQLKEDESNGKNNRN